MDTNNRPLYLGFASQKGGVGKSTLAEVLASILYYEKDIPLVVVDCDGTQESFFKLRERDRDLIGTSPDIGKALHERLAQYGKKSYQIIRSNLGQAISNTEQYLSKAPTAPQLVIFDFPGHVTTSAMMGLSIMMDYIISPIEADPQSLASSFAYAKTIQELGVGFAERSLFALEQSKSQCQHYGHRTVQSARPRAGLEDPRHSYLPLRSLQS